MLNPITVQELAKLHQTPEHPARSTRKPRVTIQHAKCLLCFLNTAFLFP